MRNVIAALLLFLASVSAALAQQSVVVPATQASVPIVGGVTAGLRLVTGIAGKRIYITNITLGPAATSVFAFTYGTGTNCGTGTTTITGSMTSDGSPLTSGNGNGAILVLPPGQDLCIIISTAAAPGSLSYAQF